MLLDVRNNFDPVKKSTGSVAKEVHIKLNSFPGQGSTLLTCWPCSRFASSPGFECFKTFFENVNLNEHKMKKTGNTYTVEKMELIGIEYLWKIVLEVPSEEIAMLAVKLLMQLSYTWLSQKLKKVCGMAL